MQKAIKSPPSLRGSRERREAMPDWGSPAVPRYRGPLVPPAGPFPVLAAWQEAHGVQDSLLASLLGSRWQRGCARRWGRVQVPVGTAGPAPAPAGCGGPG